MTRLYPTRWVFLTRETGTFFKEIIARYPELHFDFHAHNDYDLAVANVYEAIKAGAKGVHVTVNGLGERAGNAPLASVIALIHDHMGWETNVDESRLYDVSKVVETYSGVRIPKTNPSLATTCSRKWPGCMPMVIKRKTSISIT